MGVTIESPNCSIDIGYGGFYRLRQKIADLSNPALSYHYQKVLDGSSLYGENRKIFFEKYNKKTEAIKEQYNIPDGIIDFLYLSDAGATLPVEECKELWNVIKNIEDDFCIGYVGRKDCAMFSDFKDIVLDCIENNIYMCWF